MENDILNQIETVVTQIFSAKEEAAQKAATQAALQDSAKTIESLQNQVATKQAELDTLVSEHASVIDNKTTELANLTSKVEELNKVIAEKDSTISDITVKLDTASAKVAELESEKLLASRLVELEEAKVPVSSDNANLKTQITNMTNEDFASFKSDRVFVRESILKELATSIQESATDLIVTPPVQIPQDASTTVSLNMETASTGEQDAYFALGQALADEIIKKKRLN